MGQVTNKCISTIRYNNKTRKLTELERDKLEVLKGDRNMMLDLWLKYSKLTVKTKEQNEFCRYLYHRLSENDLNY